MSLPHSVTALTSTAFVGDTVYGFVVRIVGTLGGAALGLCLWYIASGSGSGNPYTFALVCAIAFPFIFFWRVHYMPPIEAILPVVTTMLIIGYSWQGGNAASYGSVGFGWSVGWRRAVCVGIGITSEFCLMLAAVGAGTNKLTDARLCHPVLKLPLLWPTFRRRSLRKVLYDARTPK